MYGLNRKEELEQLKFMLLVKASLLDRSDASAVDSFNELMRAEHELYTVSQKKAKKKSVKDKMDILAQFTNDFAKKKKFKNLQEAR